jgi:hypothetical protein
MLQPTFGSALGESDMRRLRELEERAAQTALRRHHALYLVRRGIGPQPPLHVELWHRLLRGRQSVWGIACGLAIVCLVSVVVAGLRPSEKPVRLPPNQLPPSARTAVILGATWEPPATTMRSMVADDGASRTLGSASREARAAWRLNKRSRRAPSSSPVEPSPAVPRTKESPKEGATDSVVADQLRYSLP